MPRVTRSDGKTVLLVAGAASSASDTSDHVLIAASAGLETIIEKLSVSNRTATGTEITWKSGGVVVWYTAAPTTGGAEPAIPSGLVFPQDVSYSLGDSLSGVKICAAGYRQPTS